MGLSRSGYYYEPVPESAENLALMRRLDALNLEHPVYGSRRLRARLAREGWAVNRKRVERLLGLMGVEAVYPKRQLSQPGEGQRIYPYLLEGLEITGPDQVWCGDITYVPMSNGYMYLVAVMDWWSRYVLAWELSNSLDSEFCIRAWNQALAAGRPPLIANTDQGSQFTSEAYLEAVESAGVDVGMDGRRRWIDNRFIERLWRSVKQEDIYVQDYGDGLTAQRGLARWFGNRNAEQQTNETNHAEPENLT
jgi:putative transposase